MFRRRKPRLYEANRLVRSRMPAMWRESLGDARRPDFD